MEIELRNHAPAAPVCISNGTLLYSALVHCYRSSGSSNRRKSLSRFYGSVGVSWPNWFGAGVTTVSKDYFSDSLSPIEVLSRHTMYGFYSLGLSDVRAAEWAAELIRGSARGVKRFARASGRLATTSGLRWCSACAAGECEQNGFATWQVVHQLPFVHLCPTHFVPLCTNCVRCEQPLDDARAFRLPGEGCLTCGSTEFAETESLNTEVYKKLVRRTATAIELQDATYRPQNWAMLTKRFVSKFGSFTEALCGLTDRLCSMWDVHCLESIIPSQRGTLNAPVLRDVLQGGLTTTPLLAQLIVIEAMEEICPGIRVHSSLTRSTHNELAPPTWVGHLERHALKLGVHPGLVQQIISSQSTADAAQAIGMSRFHASRLVDRINASICDELGAKCIPDEARVLSRRVPAGRRREVFRARIMALIEENPKNGRAEAWAKWPHPISWLLKNDREWLDNVLPQKPRGGRRS
jgi:hypothetical protein